MNEWKFVGQMDCDHCKYIITGCNYEGNCPYTAGWHDGQKKLLDYLIARIFSKGLDRDYLKEILKELEEK